MVEFYEANTMGTPQAMLTLDIASASLNRCDKDGLSRDPNTVAASLHSRRSQRLTNKSMLNSRPPFHARCNVTSEFFPIEWSMIDRTQVAATFRMMLMLCASSDGK